MATVGEDADLGLGEACVLEERGNLAVGVVDGEAGVGLGEQPADEMPDRPGWAADS
jgi:hypothetical protein